METKAQRIIKELSGIKVYTAGRGEELVALLTKMGFGYDYLCVIKKYPFLCTSKEGKIYPLYDMNKFLNEDQTEMEIQAAISKAIYVVDESRIYFEEGDYIIYNGEVVKVLRVLSYSNDFLCRNAEGENIEGKYEDIPSLRFASMSEISSFDKRFEKTKEKEPVYNFKAFDHVLVRDTNNQEWIPAIFHRKECEMYNFRYTCITPKGSFKQCIPYEGNEDKLGKIQQSKNHERQ